MSLLCCVRGCSNGSEQHFDPEAKFFSFPGVKQNLGGKVEELTRRRRMAWVCAVNRPNITFDYVSPLSYVCSRHFHKGQPAYETLHTDPDWVPSLNLGHPKPTITKNIGIKKSKLQMVKQKRIMKAATFLIQHECCVVNCGGRSHNDRGQRIRNGLTFYPFPSWRQNHGVFVSDLSKRQRTAWVKAVGREDITFDDIPDEARVCSRHFISGKPAYEMLESDPDWAPSLLLNNKKPEVSSPASMKEKPVKKKPTQAVTRKEKPRAPTLKDLESCLPPPAEKPQVVDESVQNFKDFFRKALKASLDSCLDAGSKPLPEALSLDPSWFSAPKKTPQSLAQGQPDSSSASVVSEETCENCVRLQERITQLEERLAAPQYIQWAQPLPQTELQREHERLSPESSSPPSKATFHQEWLARHWFLRYSPKLNVMWCHVCRLYGGEFAGRKGAFVKGTRAFQTFTIVQHSKSSHHEECVRKFKSRKGRVRQ